LLCNSPFYFSPFNSYDPVTGRLHETQTTPFPLYNDCVTVERPDVKSVWAYTNGDEVELFLNGESQGRQAVAPFDKGTWILSFDPGERFCLFACFLFVCLFVEPSSYRIRNVRMWSCA